ncbi:MAG: hypothetical protein ABR583_05655 [Gaiellaceae bacterium]
MTVVEPTEEPTRHARQTEELEADDGGTEEGYWRHTLAALISPGALALSAFALASSGLVALVGPLSLISSFSYNDQAPAESAKNLAYLGIGIAIVAFALALWSLLRPEPEMLWPRIVAGAAATVALMVIFQYAVVLLMAANAVPVESFVQ